MTNDAFLLFLWGIIAFLTGGLTEFVVTGIDGGKRAKNYRRKIAQWMRYRIQRRGRRGRGVNWVFSPVRRLRTTFSLISIPFWMSVAGFVVNYLSTTTYIPGAPASGFLLLAVGGWLAHMGMRALTVRDSSDLEAECVYAALTTPAGTPERFLQFFAHPELDFRFAGLRAWSERRVGSASLQARAAEVAVGFLSDKSFERRKLAYEFLYRHAPGVLKEKLGRVLEHPVAEVRKHALEYIRVLSPAERTAALKSRLSDVKADVAAAAAKLLNEQPKNIEEYLSDLREGSIPLRILAAEYFAEHPDARAFEGLAALLKFDDWKARRAAAAALGRMEDAQAETALSAFCADVQSYAANEATQRREAYLEAVQGLRNHVFTGGQRPTTTTVRGLVRLVGDDDPKVAKAAAAALREMQQTEALVQTFETGGPAVREIVLLTLADSTDEALLPIFRKGLESPDSNVVKAAATAIGHSPYVEDALALLPLLKHNDTSVVYAAVNALGKIGALPTLAALSELVQKTQTLMRRSTAYADAGESKKNFTLLYNKARDAIRRIIQKQSALPAYPVEKFYCRKCFSRFRKSIAETWEYIECKRCRDDRHHLVPVDKIVGFIGDAYETEYKAGVFYVELWDEKSKSTVDAEIDEMIIVGGGSVSYDWAVSAVLQKLQESGQNVPVKLVGPPRLTANTQAMLRDYCPAVFAPE